VVAAFIADHQERFGVEPICRVLTEHGIKIAPNTFYAARNRPPSKRALRDAEMLVEIKRVYFDPQLGRGLYCEPQGAASAQARGLRRAPLPGRAVDESRRPAGSPARQAVRHHPARRGRTEPPWV
jgi:putative transposase